MGKRFVQKAIDAFEESHPGVRIELRVTRRPYSWAGDDRTVEQEKVRYGSDSWKKDKGYDEEGDAMRRKWREENIESYKEAPKSTDIERTPMDELGRLSSIDFDTAKEMKWHPVDSQRTILWAARFGLAEEFAEALSARHFSQGETNADVETILAAVGDVSGLDVDGAAAFLETDEFVDEVWESYGRMIKHFGITEIPVFSFSRLGAPSPFDPTFTEGVDATPYIVVGSSSVDILKDVFVYIHDEMREAQEQDDALREQFVDKTVALQDGRQGKVLEVELGGALIIELPDGKLVRQRTRPPPEPQGGNAAPGPNNAGKL